MYNYGFKTLGELGVDLDAFHPDNRGWPNDIDLWLVVCWFCEPSRFDDIQADVADDILREERKNASRLLYEDNGSGLLLVVNPSDEDACKLAARLAVDINSGVALRPDRVQEAIDETAGDEWDQAEAILRFKWLKNSGLSMARAFDDECPRQLSGLIARDLVYGH